MKGIDAESNKGKGKEGEAANDNAAGAKEELSDKDKEELKDIEELLVELDNKVSHSISSRPGSPFVLTLEIPPSSDRRLESTE